MTYARTDPFGTGIPLTNALVILFRRRKRTARIRFTILAFAVGIITGQCRAGVLSSSYSPDKKFAISFSSYELPCLVEVATGRVVAPELTNDEAREPSILWSKDSSRFAVWVQSARFADFGAYRLSGTTFVVLSIPDITLPYEKSLEHKKSRQIGERTIALRWVGDNILVINKTGTINFYDTNGEPDGGFDYSYDITIEFDKQGVGKAAKIKKAPLER